MQLNLRVPALPRTLSPRSLGWLGVALMLAVAFVPWGARPALSANPDSISVAAPIDVTVAPGATASFGLLTVGSTGNSSPCNTTLSAAGLPAGASAIFGTNPVVTTGTPATSTLQIDDRYGGRRRVHLHDLRSGFHPARGRSMPGD